MRIIGTLPHENQARKISLYLKAQGIPNKCEMTFDSHTAQMSYQIWILDEDQIAEAKACMEEFSKNEMDPKFDTLIEEPEVQVIEEGPPQPPPTRFGHHLTTLCMGLCIFAFFLQMMQVAQIEEAGMGESQTVMAPIQEALMYDVPPGFEEGKPYWKGVYELAVHKMKGQDPAPGLGPLFTKIKEGEVWRLVSPIFLHGSLLHILFNMLWLWYLGRPIEQRIGPFRTLILTLAAAITPNTVQYLMSGPFFIGYSGVIAAMAGFIWMREREAPWEGYPLSKSSIVFLLVFISAIFVIQLVAFAIQLFTQYNFAPNIANTAHIVGAIVGIMLGRYKYFSQKIVKGA